MRKRRFVPATLILESRAMLDGDIDTEIDPGPGPDHGPTAEVEMTIGLIPPWDVIGGYTSPIVAGPIFVEPSPTDILEVPSWKEEDGSPTYYDDPDPLKGIDPDYVGWGPIVISPVDAFT